jgi:hypothetical protein
VVNFEIHLLPNHNYFFASNFIRIIQYFVYQNFFIYKIKFYSTHQHATAFQEKIFFQKTPFCELLYHVSHPYFILTHSHFEAPKWPSTILYLEQHKTLLNIKKTKEVTYSIQSSSRTKKSRRHMSLHLTHAYNYHQVFRDSSPTEPRASMLCNMEFIGFCTILCTFIDIML